MKKYFFPATVILFLIAAESCCKVQKEDLFNGKDLSNWTIFLKNPDANPDSVFSVADGVINVAGQPFGYLRTKKEYNNYKLHVEYRWVGTPTNSGIFLNTSGEDKVWPRCMECQLANLKAGDIILMNVGTGISVRDTSFVVESSERPYFAVKKSGDSSEKPAGEWNSVDILCETNNLEITVNGVLQNKGSNMTQTSGSICLQSEGGPLQFRNVYIEPLK